jgi:hypothetical protein
MKGEHRDDYDQRWGEELGRGSQSSWNFAHLGHAKGATRGWGVISKVHMKKKIHQIDIALKGYCCEALVLFSHIDLDFRYNTPKRRIYQRDAYIKVISKFVFESGNYTGVAYIKETHRAYQKLEISNN